MRIFLTGAAVVSLAAIAWGVQPATPSRKTTTKSAAAHSASAPKKSATTTTAAVHKSGPATTTAARKAPAKKAAPVVRTTWRNRQAAPSIDRFKEIQFALATKGYLSPDSATGVWDQTSADALRRFQSDQNIDCTGKINALSLIALGLGPHYDSSKAIIDTGSR